MTEKTFAKPPVVEIVCQFRFTVSEENKWTSKKPGELLKALSDKYPNLETPQDIGVGIHIREGSITPELLAPKQRFVYSDEGGNCSVTVAPDSFAFIYKISDKHPYKSWEISFKPALHGAWEKVSECLDVTQIKSIGVRYINHIDKAYGVKPHEALKADSRYLPEAIVSDHFGFFNRSEIATDEKNRMIIQVGVAFKEDNSADKIVILDIDRIIEDAIAITANRLPSELSKLQQDIEDVFFSSISDTLKKKMEPKQDANAVK